MWWIRPNLLVFLPFYQYGVFDRIFYGRIDFPCVFSKASRQEDPFARLKSAMPVLERSTIASPVKHHPKPSALMSGSIRAAPIAAAGLRRSEVNATRVAACPGATSVT
ncbi:hypothetical protein I7I48_05055 [Histoplasma ohiense]|nr:hypothetical protein I7I48_05055 [Histoplasma ohiense (nom. inval.)]